MSTRTLSFLTVVLLTLGACSAPASLDGSSIREQFGRLVVGEVPLEHRREVALNGLMEGVSAETLVRLVTHTGPIDISGGHADTFELLVTVESQIPDDGVVEFVDGVLSVRSAEGAACVINGVRARLPRDVSLELSSGSGEILVQGFSGVGEIRIEAPVGAVSLSELSTGRLAVLGGGGFVKCTRVIADEAVFELGTGALQALESEFDTLEASTVTGEMQFADCRVRRGDFRSATGNLALLNTQVAHLERSLGAGRLHQGRPEGP